MPHSSKARYAAAAVIDLASQTASRPTTLAAIAKRQNISVSYLEQLFARLRAAGILKSVRGPGGGYVLARGSHEITIADIYDAVHDRNEEHAADSGALKATALWQAVDREVMRFLRGITVQDVMSDKIATAPAS